MSSKKRKRNESSTLTRPTLTVASIAMIGFGSVSKTVSNLLIQKKSEFESNYHTKFELVYVSDSSGIIYTQTNGSSLNLTELLELKKSKKKFSDLNESDLSKICPSAKLHSNDSPKTQSDFLSKLQNLSLVFDCSPVNLEHGDPGLSIAKAVLKKGVGVVFANKGPIALEYETLKELASQNNTHIKFSATFCGGLPVLNVIQRDCVGGKVKSMRGIFNSTSNFILCEMATGRSYESALKEAQDRGIAETNPSLDVEGFDTAQKVVIFARAALGIKCSLKDVRVQGITHITKSDIDKAKSDKKVYKLVGSVVAKDDSFQNYDLSVEAVLVDESNFLGSCSGWEMGLILETDIYGKCFFKLDEREPIPTSASVLRDAIHILHMKS